MENKQVKWSVCVFGGKWGQEDERNLRRPVTINIKILIITVHNALVVLRIGVQSRSTKKKTKKKKKKLFIQKSYANSKQNAHINIQNLLEKNSIKFIKAPKYIPMDK